MRADARRITTLTHHTETAKSRNRSRAEPPAPATPASRQRVSVGVKQVWHSNPKGIAATPSYQPLRRQRQQAHAPGALDEVL